VGADRAQIEEALNAPRVVMGVAKTAHLVRLMIAAGDLGATGPIAVPTTPFVAQASRSPNVISVRRRGVRNGEAWLAVGPTTRVSIREVLALNLMSLAPRQLEMMTNGNVGNPRLGRIALTGRGPQARHSN